MKDGIELTDEFWDESDYYKSPNSISDNAIQEVEEQLGYKLPQSYINLIRTQNGGTPRNTCFRTLTANSYAEDHIAISAIHGIGGMWGIDSRELGSKFMIEEWGYPDIGIVICSCPSAGHDSIMLDYSDCGPSGEPRVIHVDVETLGDPQITILAQDFQSFISGLVSEEELPGDSEELKGYEVLDVWINPEFAEMLKKNENKNLKK
jgi:SMI1 / KNR4 family.